MKERKNIDRLYQENFKDFEATPREEAWQNIAARLQKKEEKKPFLIPLWYKLGGIAAAVAVIFGLAYLMNKDSINPGTEVVFEIEDSARPSIDVPLSNTRLQEASRLLDSVRSRSDKNTQNSQYTLNSDNSSRGKSPASKQSNSYSNQAEENTEAEEEILAIQDNPNQVSEENEENNLNDAKNNSSAIAGNEPIENEDTQKSASEEKPNENSIEENQNALAQLADQKNGDRESVAEPAKEKVRLSTFAAPIFYDNLGNGNAISPEFNDNNSQAQVTVAYGLNIAYPITEKISIRTGISKVNISYDIQEISYAPSAFAQSIQSIDYNSNNAIQVQDESPGIRIPDFGGLSGEEFSNSSSAIAPNYVSGELNQQYGFIEVPLEIEYALIDKKFDLNLIGGGSSLFLDQNSVSILANNQRTELGEANNINKVSFSTNIGLGLGYELMPDFRLNVEPIFKYQLNTFKGTSGVQPFFFGIYSGFSYKF
ncbi:hypothetical protein [Zunongwangia sp. H14]|uniref:hypothetical protein n=1 Tax=Zunongwangia sp. H14 TaxID=3240792 RepID=UPI0035639EF8